MKARLRRKKICKAMKIIWSSLETHLEHAVDSPKGGKSLREFTGTKKWNANTILEYCKVLSVLAYELKCSTAKK